MTLNGKWTLNRLIGQGGMASVYLATHRNGKNVAIKILHMAYSFDAGIRERFVREGYAANQVNHPGVVTVDDDDVTPEGAAFLVMELLDGCALDEYVERRGGTVPASEVVRISRAVLDVMVAAHEKGIVHRDLKPENVFLTADGGVKILDFGIARVRERTNESSATKTGSLLGTPSFMPPEQARGEWAEVDARADV